MVQILCAFCEEGEAEAMSQAGKGEDNFGALFLQAGGLQAIHGPDPVQAFLAMTTIHDNIHKGPGHDLTSIVKALVDTLEHESPFCMAAAAGALRRVAEYAEQGKILIQDSGALPALIRVVKRRCPVADLEKEAAVFRRPVLNCRCALQNKALCFNDPSGLALLGLVAAAPYSQQMLDSFLEAGGVSALTALLRESRSPIVIACTAQLIFMLLEDARPCKKRTWGQEVANKFFHSGFCGAAVSALRLQYMDVRKNVLFLLAKFFNTVSKRLKSAAIAELVAAKGVELTACVVGVGGMDMIGCGSAMLQILMGHVESSDRAYAPGCASQIIHCCAKWLSEGQGDQLVMAAQMLHSILLFSDDPIPAAVRANVTPGLVQVLRELLSHPQSSTPPAIDAAFSNIPAPGLPVCTPLTFPVGCLAMIMRNRTDDATAAWKPLLDAGTVSLLSDVIGLGHEELMSDLLVLVLSLLPVIPSGATRQCLGRLPRVVAGLLELTPPLAPDHAVDTLFVMALRYAELLTEFRAWGMLASLKRLTRHKDPKTVSAAKQLLHVINKGFDFERTYWLDRGTRSCVCMGFEEAIPPDCLPDEGQMLYQAPITSPPRQDHSSGPPNKPHCPRADAADSLQGLQERTGSHHRTELVWGFKPDQEQPHVAPNPPLPSQEQPPVAPDPASPTGSSRVVPNSHARRAARKNWACGHCGQKAEMLEKGKLRECAGCGSVRYCGKDCQLADWPAHKAACKESRAARGVTV